jgi:phospho-N-acetylmuramoyl-pentapeptide-transferase
VYISLLTKWKAGKKLRDTTMTWHEASIFKNLHQHKAWTPTMWWWMFLLIMAIMVAASFLIQDLWWINNTLVNRQETYILLVAFFGLWLLGLIDDFLNIRGRYGIKGITAKMKLLWMFLFSWFIAYWFGVRLGIDYFNLWPILGVVDMNLVGSIILFFLTVALVNAINITDGLDGLVWWLLLVILPILWLLTFLHQWYLATTLIGILIGVLVAFLRFNINPARIFMWDSWALALWGFISTLVYLINIKFGILLPFMILFLLFWIELASSGLQLFWKKFFKKKLFSVAPFHHYLEYKQYPEHTIVMKFWFVQAVLWAIVLVMIIYQFYA